MTNKQTTLYGPWIRTRFRHFLGGGMASLLAIGLGASSVLGQTPPNIIWVSFHPDDNVPSDAALGAGFTKAPDVEYTQLLRGSGANVTRYITTGTPDVALLNTADLVIISRSVNSGAYANDSATTWNSVTAPTIIMSGYIIRSNRLGFTTGTSIPDTIDNISLKIHDPSHAIFNGIALDGNNDMVNPFAGILTFNGLLQRGISVNNSPLSGAGVLLASVATASDPAVDGMVIGEWQAGDSIMHDGGAGTDVLGGHRMVFLSGSREQGIPGDGAGIFDLEADGETLFYNAVNYMAGSNLVPPPRISQVSPANGSIFADSSSGLSFVATSAEAIPTDGIQVIVNGVDVSSELTIGGSETAREVSYAGLMANQGYNIDISIQNAAGSRAVNVAFDTFSQDGNLVIEAEDFNFGGGSFFDVITLCNDFGGVIPGCYFDRVSVSGIDALDGMGFADDSAAADNLYRFGPAISKDEQVDTINSNDTRRQKFIDAGDGANGPIRDFDVETLNAGDWQNYTRTVEEGTYVAYLRVSSSVDQEVQLGVVTSNPAQANQTVEVLGSFKVTAGGYKSIGLTGIGTDTLKPFQAGGQTTFRLTAVSGGGNLRLNYFFLVPFDQEEIPTLAGLLSPSDGDRFVAGSEVVLQASASGPDGTANTITQVEFFVDGNSVGVDTTSPYEVVVSDLGLGAHSVTVTATDSNGGSVTSDPISIEVRDLVKANLGTVVWVSFHAEDGVPAADAATAGFTEAADIGYTALLRANGYEVVRYVTTGTPDPAVLNEAQLILISRSVPSGNYQDAAATAWNSITAPMIVMGGYTIRNSRMGYTTGGTIPDTVSPIRLAVAQPEHPIFAGVALDEAGLMVNEFAGITEFAGNVQRGISVNTDPVAGDGVVLATVGTVGEPTFGGLIIGEWQKGATMGNGTADTLAGHRLVFLSGSREAAGLTSQGAGIYDLTEDGATLFLNAVRYMLHPEPYNLVWVSFHENSDVPSTAAGDAGFTEAADRGYTDLLEANGYQVSRYLTTATPDAELLNAADLVVISRSVPSGNYQNAAATAWNSIKTPMIVMGGYVIRNSRMGFTTGGTIPDTAGPIGLNVTQPDHPIFIGVDLDASNTMVNPFANIVTILDLVQRGISVNTDPLAGDGTLLATVATEGDPTFGGMIIGEWEAGVAMGNGTADILAGPRIVFLSGSREQGFTSEGAGIFDLEADGVKLFLNAVRYAVTLKEPDTVLLDPAFESVTLNADGSLTLVWNGVGELQMTGSLTNPDWQPVAGNGTATVTPQGNAFFRLVR